MIFSSPEFFVLLGLVLLGLRLLSTENQRRNLLLVASYVFYGWWDWRYGFLILASSVLDHVAAHRMVAAREHSTRRAWLFVSLLGNLGSLAFFKYTNFGLDTLAALTGVQPPSLHIVLPVGISFFTFQTMSYSIDVYRGNLKPTNNFRDFALFVAFFPQLVAGPIVRASEFLPQLDEEHPLRADHVVEGADRFVRGFVKKLLFADTLSVFVDRVFADPTAFDPLTTWAAVAAYAAQIYYDFSGYSDMAIGTGRMLGFEFPVNFRHPYLSTSITEFWRRWHISLSGWLRDYLYISLGGNRHGVGRTYVNLAVTMLLGGLWHGASWNFVLWGALHGGGLAVERWWASLRGYRAGERGAAPWQVLGWSMTFVFTMFTWVVFRADTFATSIAVYRKMLFVDPGGFSWVYTPAAIVLGAGAVLHVGTLLRQEREYALRLHTPSGAALAAACLLLVLFFSPLDTSPFIYFQF